MLDGAVHTNTTPLFANTTNYINLRNQRRLPNPIITIVLDRTIFWNANKRWFRARSLHVVWLWELWLFVAVAVVVPPRGKGQHARSFELLLVIWGWVLLLELQPDYFNYNFFESFKLTWRNEVQPSKQTNHEATEEHHWHDIIIETLRQ